VQRAIDSVKAAHRTLILTTQYPTCCNHGGKQSRLNLVNKAVRQLGAANHIPVVDLDKAWRTTCRSIPVCGLINLPEGLHPSPRGYDVITQTILATLAGIDIFKPGGAALVEQAFHLRRGSVIVKPSHSR
jgi:lysophospholipase L1-like esterase